MLHLLQLSLLPTQHNARTIIDGHVCHHTLGINAALRAKPPKNRFQLTIPQTLGAALLWSMFELLHNKPGANGTATRSQRSHKNIKPGIFVLFFNPPVDV